MPAVEPVAWSCGSVPVDSSFSCAVKHSPARPSQVLRKTAVVFGLLVWLLCALLVGWVLTGAATGDGAVPGIGSSAASSLLRLSLSAICGVALSSVLLAWCSVYWHGLGMGARLSELVVLAAIAGLGGWWLWSRGRSAASEAIETSHDSSEPNTTPVATAAQPSHGSDLQRHLWNAGPSVTVALLVLITGQWLAMLAPIATNPEGYWDAWSIWNVRAIWLVRTPTDEWEQVWQEPAAAGHAEYPWLLPLTVARAWSWLGQEAAEVPQTIAWLVAGLTATLLAGACGKRWGLTSGLIAASVVLANPSFAKHLSWQYADGPLALLFLASCVVAEESTRSTARFGVLGVLVGAAAWTKNEGLAFGAIAAVWVAANNWPIARWRYVIAFLLGGLPFWITVNCTRAWSQQPTDVLVGHTLPGVWAKLSSSGRWTLIGSKLGGELLHAAWPLLVVFALACVILGYRRLRTIVARGYCLNSQRTRSDGPRPATNPRSADEGFDNAKLQSPKLLTSMPAAVWLIGPQIGITVLIFALTPADLDWHLRTAADRMITQWWPTFCWIGCVFVLRCRASFDPRPAR